MIAARLLEEIAPIKLVLGLVTTLLLAGAVLWVYLTGREHGAAASASRISKLESEVQALESAAAATDFLENARKRFAEANKAAYEEALRQSRAALEDAREEKERVAGEFDHWKRTWGRQSRDCTAARKALDTACPELRDY